MAVVVKKGSPLDLVANVNCYLLDIEGTTTSIDFVKETLVPYVEQYLENFILSNWDVAEVQEAISDAHNQAILDREEHLEGFVPLPTFPTGTDKEYYVTELVANLKWQMSIDRKSAALKKLQGMLWRIGYEKGELQGHLYRDFAVALNLWTTDKEKKKKIYIYSSGSAEAQRCLFRYSIFGNLEQLIDGYFDTTIGYKFDACSYMKISNKVKEEPSNILFFTDRPREILSAHQSGMKTVLVVRDLSNPFLIAERELQEYADAIIFSFADIFPKEVIETQVKKP